MIVLCFLEKVVVSTFSRVDHTGPLHFQSKGLRRVHSCVLDVTLLLSKSLSTDERDGPGTWGVGDRSERELVSSLHLSSCIRKTLHLSSVLMTLLFERKHFGTLTLPTTYLLSKEHSETNDTHSGVLQGK